VTLGSLDHGFEDWEQPDPGDGEAVLADAVAALAAAFGPRLLAVYALGSLAHGGFRPLVSDVDVAAILTDPIEPDGSRSPAFLGRDPHARAFNPRPGFGGRGVGDAAERRTAVGRAQVLRQLMRVAPSVQR